MRHDNTLKFIERIRFLFDILVIAITFLSIFNIGWVLLAKDMYWPLYSKIANILGLTLFFGFFVFVSVVIWSHFKPLIKIITSVTVVITFFFEFTNSEVASYVDSKTINNETIILARYSQDNGSSCYQVLGCKTNSTYCKESDPHLDFCSIGNPGPESMLINETGDLDIFIDGILAYTYKSNSDIYEIEDLAFGGQYTYWVVQTKTNDSILFVFGRCNQIVKEDCEVLKKYINPNFQHVNIELDINNNASLVFHE